VPAGIFFTPAEYQHLHPCSIYLPALINSLTSIRPLEASPDKSRPKTAHFNIPEKGAATDDSFPGGLLHLV
jgi:hypothetical protein